MRWQFLPALLAAMAALGANEEEKITLPTSQADILQGKKLFLAQCARCHGTTGGGGSGPPLTRVKLPHAPDDSALVKVLSDGIRGTEMPGAGAMSKREILQTAGFVRSLGKITVPPVPGDAVHGAEIYRGKGCTGCHSIHGEGGVAGPDLTEIGDARSAGFLRESLLEPEAAVPDGYLLVTVTAASGPRVSGVRLNEDSFSIQIRDNAGVSHSFWKKDLAKIEKQPGKSAMPSYEGQLSEGELTDLVAYLASLKEGK